MRLVLRLRFVFVLRVRLFFAGSFSFFAGSLFVFEVSSSLFEGSFFVLCGLVISCLRVVRS